MKILDEHKSLHSSLIAGAVCLDKGSFARIKAVSRTVMFLEMDGGWLKPSLWNSYLESSRIKCVICVNREEMRPILQITLFFCYWLELIFKL